MSQRGAGSVSRQEEQGFGTLLRAFQDQIPVSCQKYRTLGFFKSSTGQSHYKLSHLTVHAYKQTESGCQEFCLCRQFSGRYLCIFHPSFAMDSQCCFLSRAIFRELMDRWRQDDNVSFCHRTTKYFSLERNCSAKGRRRKDMNLLLPYAPSERPAGLRQEVTRGCALEASHAFVICFCAGCSFQSC